ncbi:hypothetical protein JR316_0001922 [Psilocybe cubensis]|uniref:Uncharacterized protein n=1 Tax=Psilocybe cubensis TaxID=181762 RepID=A0ACB8HAP3_PSICU|nr:hypothetical protein JR316_0001922 [Psilocybe cubensis]KAH9485018.1 hypothetical protein JR316_0001922 [Psilocybe cubensis]
MVDFRTILKVEDHSRSQRSLKDIFTGLVEEQMCIWIEALERPRSILNMELQQRLALTLLERSIPLHISRRQDLFAGNWNPLKVKMTEYMRILALVMRKMISLHMEEGLARGSRSGPGISLLPNGPTVATPLTCDSRIYLSLCGEIIAYDLNSEPSNPQVVIELLRATKSERGNYMIAGAFYRRMGHPQSAKAVLLSMLEEFSGTIDSEFLRPAYLLLSGCELDIARVNKAANTDASVQYAAAQTWLQKVFGKSRSRDVSSGQKENRQELGAARSAADNRMCTCGGEYKNPKFRGQINIMEREIQCLRDRNTNQQKQLSNLRSLKRKLEDDVFYERDMRRKYQRQLEDLERIYPREREAHVLELASGHVDRA